MSKLVLFTLAIPGLSLLALISAAVEETLPGLGTLIFPVIVIILLVLLNGLFVASEFSIIGVRASQMEQAIAEGNGRARTVLSILESRPKQDQYIATAQLGITIASLGLAMYGEPQIAHFIEPYLARLMGQEPTAVLVNTIGSTVALGLLTYLHVVLGEMVPKLLALTDSKKMVLWLLRPMQIAETVLSIPVRILNNMGRILLRLFRVPVPEGHARVLSPEELELLVTESAGVGLLKEGEEEMIRNIFDFSDRVVGQVMTPRTKVQAIPSNLPISEMLKIVTESRHSRFPVYEQDLDHIVGILHLKDLIRQTIKGREDTPFDLRLILREAPTVPEDYEVARLLAHFKQQRLHMAIVVDEFGGMAGIVTLEDLVEEVVGEVRDEFDLEKEPFVELEPGIVEVAGNFLVDDLVEKVFVGDVEYLPDVETVGGLIVTWLGRLPVKGDEVSRHDVHFRVLDVEKRAVARARIEYPVHEGEDEEEADGG